MVELLGPERHVVVAREVTKLHEEFLRGRAEDVLDKLKRRGEVKGEITLLIGKAKKRSSSASTEDCGQAGARADEQRIARRKGRAETGGKRIWRVEERSLSRAAAGEVGEAISY